jgi:hypothetical protein
MLTRKDMFKINNIHDTVTYGIDYADRYDFIDEQDEVKINNKV